jgi:hypothetical protein
MSVTTRVAVGALVVIVCGAAVVAVGVVRAYEERVCTLIGSANGVQIDLGLPDMRKSAHAFSNRFRRADQSRLSFSAKLDRDLHASYGVRRIVVCADGRCTAHRVAEFAELP